MARTSNAARAATLEAKALANSNKSEGMRMLFEAGKTVAEVAKIFDAPYGYVYGVAKRAGFAETAAKRRVPKAAAAERKTAAARREQKASPPARKPSGRAKTAPATKPGRPSPARRAANRKAAKA